MYESTPSHYRKRATTEFTEHYIRSYPTLVEMRYRLVFVVDNNHHPPQSNEEIWWPAFVKIKRNLQSNICHLPDRSCFHGKKTVFRLNSTERTKGVCSHDSFQPVLIYSGVFHIATLVVVATWHWYLCRKTTNALVLATCFEGCICRRKAEKKCLRE
jgi:hypothetical protein